MILPPWFRTTWPWSPQRKTNTPLQQRNNFLTGWGRIQLDHKRTWAKKRFFGPTLTSKRMSENTVKHENARNPGKEHILENMSKNMTTQGKDPVLEANPLFVRFFLGWFFWCELAPKSITETVPTFRDSGDRDWVRGTRKSFIFNCKLLPWEFIVVIDFLCANCCSVIRGFGLWKGSACLCADKAHCRPFWSRFSRFGISTKTKQLRIRHRGKEFN